jgi:hypothetical protein
MDKDVRNRIQRATQRARGLLEKEFSEQLEGTFDIDADGSIADEPGAHLDERGRLLRTELIAAIEHRTSALTDLGTAVADYQREAAFTCLNRFVALKMLESRGLLQECVSKGDQSAGFKEFTGLAAGLVQLPDRGYRLYLECLFDEVAQEVGVLFDRSDPSSLLWPRGPALLELLEVLNDQELEGVWVEDETIGWVYQYFNSGEERKQMRDESGAPRNSRELAVRNQFFTPRYVVEFLVDNTLGRTWLDMTGEQSELRESCEYFVRASDDPGTARERKDPRDLRILDPACGSGHFLLYSFDLLTNIYSEAWADEGSQTPSELTGQSLREDYPDEAALERALPTLILEHNLYGVDIDPRCAQIAALALWMRAQRAWEESGVPKGERPPIRRTNIVVAEAMPGDAEVVDAFAASIDPPLLGALFKRMVEEMKLAGELGPLLRAESTVTGELAEAREQLAAAQAAGVLPGMERARGEGELDLAGVDDDQFFQEAELRISDALRSFAEATAGASGVSRRLFADDAGQGIAFIEVLRHRFDVVLMNPPFGAASLLAKDEFEKAYPKTKNDIYAAFVERGIELLHPGGLLGAITSRTGFFLSSFQKWREEIILGSAPPVVFADLGHGVLDSAMVEVAAYCLQRDAGGVRG